MDEYKTLKYRKVAMTLLSMMPYWQQQEICPN